MLDQCFHVLGEKKLRKMLPDELKVTLAQASTIPLSPRRGMKRSSYICAALKSSDDLNKRCETSQVDKLAACWAAKRLIFRDVI